MAKAGEELAYIEGYDTLRRLLNPPDALIAAPWKEAMTELADEGAKLGVSGAPSRSAPVPPKGYGGPVRNKIKAAVMKGAFPKWAAVRVRAKQRSAKYPKGYDYPRLLEYSDKHGRAGWFDRAAVAPIGQKVDATLTNAANKIAEKWGRE